MAGRQAHQETPPRARRPGASFARQSSVRVALAAVVALSLFAFGCTLQRDRGALVSVTVSPVTGTPQSGVRGAAARLPPYSAASPWNRPIGPNPAYDQQTNRKIARLSGLFSADPMGNTFPIYEVRGDQPLRTVKLWGVFSDATDGGRKVANRESAEVRAPIPDGAEPASGTDAHILIWNVDTGDEWGFWQFRGAPDGTYSAVNGYHYNAKWTAVPPAGLFVSRGSGIPNIAGVIRPWEIAQGHIDHALAFAYPSPTSQFVYPAINSDGSSTNVYDLPEGARLQLDPKLTDADFDRWGLDRAGKIVARALQEYGLIVTDRSDTPQLFVEYEGTAHWNGVVNANTVVKIPYSALRVLADPAKR